MFNVKKWNILEFMIHTSLAGQGRGGAQKSKVIKKAGQPQKKSDVLGGARGGWGQNNLTHTLAI